MLEDKSFKAMIVEEAPGKIFTRKIGEKTVNELPQGEVLIRVVYSSLNYKDALSASGNKGVTKNYPHTPGIDAAGTVEHSLDDRFQAGDNVIVTSYDLGMNTSGGFGEYIRVPAEWVVRLPENLSLKESMIYGTAGFTAGMSVDKIVENVRPGQGKILVTGTSGGVGSTAASILIQTGYDVAGVCGGTEEQDFLEEIGVNEILSREEAADSAGKPILKERWAGAIDTVGGDILATAIKSIQLGGVVTCCGNVASPDLPLTVFPFILRGISLFGIDSQHCPMDLRRKIWEKLSTDWKLGKLNEISTEISLNDLDEHIQLMLDGKGKGRKVLNLKS